MFARISLFPFLSLNNLLANKMVEYLVSFGSSKYYLAIYIELQSNAFKRYTYIIVLFNMSFTPFVFKVIGCFMKIWINTLRCTVLFFRIKFSVSFGEPSHQRCQFKIPVETIKPFWCRPTKQICILQLPISVRRYVSDQKPVPILLVFGNSCIKMQRKVLHTRQTCLAFFQTVFWPWNPRSKVIRGWNSKMLQLGWNISTNSSSRHKE